jgi:hypothetical protein
MTDQPIAWGMPRPDGTIIDCITPEEHAREPGQYTVPLYAAPQPRRRLTDEEISDLAMRSGAYDEQLLAFARAIEAAVWGEKT